MELIDIWNINRYICKLLHKAKLLLCCTYCGNDLPLTLDKVFFSDNNSDVFEWNGIDVWNINRYLCTVLNKARIITLTCLLSNTVRYWNTPIHYLITYFLIICSMYSYVLYYCTEKSGYYADSPYVLFAILLLFLLWKGLIPSSFEQTRTQGCFVEKMKMWTDYRQMGRWREGIRKAFSSDELKMFVFNEWKNEDCHCWHTRGS